MISFTDQKELSAVYKMTGTASAKVGHLVSIHLHIKEDGSKFEAILEDGGIRPIYLSNSNCDRLEISGIGNIIRII